MISKGKTGFGNFMSADKTERYAQSFLHKNEIEMAYDFFNFPDNPYLFTRSNLSNFEYRTFYEYLNSGKDGKELNTFKNYLKNKGSVYHSGMLELLKNIAASFNISSEKLQ